MQNGEHWWCRQERLMVEMLFLFQFPDVVVVKELQSKTAAQLCCCTPCLLSYHRAKRAVRRRYESEFEEESVENFFRILHKQDVERLSGKLRSGELAECVRCVYEVLRAPELLRVPVVRAEDAVASFAFASGVFVFALSSFCFFRRLACCMCTHHMPVSVHCARGLSLGARCAQFKNMGMDVDDALCLQFPSACKCF
jgi:hypothetical protein